MRLREELPSSGEQAAPPLGELHQLGADLEDGVGAGGRLVAGVRAGLHQSLGGPQQGQRPVLQRLSGEGGGGASASACDGVCINTTMV